MYVNKDVKKCVCLSKCGRLVKPMISDLTGRKQTTPEARILREAMGLLMTCTLGQLWEVLQRLTAMEIEGQFQMRCFSNHIDGDDDSVFGCLGKLEDLHRRFYSLCKSRIYIDSPSLSFLPKFSSSHRNSCSTKVVGHSLKSLF